MAEYRHDDYDRQASFSETRNGDEWDSGSSDDAGMMHASVGYGIAGEISVSPTSDAVEAQHLRLHHRRLKRTCGFHDPRSLYGVAIASS